MAGVCGQGVHGRWGACMTGGMHYSGGMCGGGRGEPAWQERWPLQRAVRILLERILVFPKIVPLKSLVIHPRELLLGYH